MREVSATSGVVVVDEVDDVEVDDVEVVEDVLVDSAASLGLQAASSRASVTSLATVVRIGASLRSGRFLSGINPEALCEPSVESFAHSPWLRRSLTETPPTTSRWGNADRG